MKTAKEMRDELVAGAMPHQRQFWRDKHPRKSVLGGRRGGKSRAFTDGALVVGCDRPGSNIVYVCTTREMAFRNMWNDPKEGLLVRNKRNDWGLSFKRGEGVVELHNGSRVTLGGALTEGSIERLRGQYADVFILDECGTFPPKQLWRLLKSVVGPMLIDYPNTELWMGGTPGTLLDGEYYEATAYTWDDEKKIADYVIDMSANVLPFRPYAQRRHDRWKGRAFQWSFHHWAVKNNKKRPGLWERALEEKVRNEWADDAPEWLSEYCGIWVPYSARSIYRLAPSLFQAMPEKEHDFEHALGVHIAQNGSIGVVVAASAPTCTNAYECESIREDSLSISELGRLLTGLERKYQGFDVTVGSIESPGQRRIFDSLSTRFGIHLTEGNRLELPALVRIVAADFDDERLMLQRESPLAKQLKHAQWDVEYLAPSGDTPHECASALAQLHPFLDHTLATEVDHGPEPGTPEWIDERERQALEAAERMELAERRRGMEDWSGHDLTGDETIDELLKLI